MTNSSKTDGLRKRIYVIMDTEQENPDWAAWLFEFFITALIILSVVSIIAESFIDNRYAGSIAEWTERMERNKQLEIYFNYFETFGKRINNTKGQTKIAKNSKLQNLLLEIKL